MLHDYPLYLLHIVITFQQLLYLFCCPLAPHDCCSQRLCMVRICGQRIQGGLSHGRRFVVEKIRQIVNDICGSNGCNALACLPWCWAASGNMMQYVAMPLASFSTRFNSSPEFLWSSPLYRYSRTIPCCLSENSLMTPRSRRTRYTSSSRTDMMLVECFFAGAPNCIRASMAHNLHRGGCWVDGKMARNVALRSWIGSLEAICLLTCCCQRRKCQPFASGNGCRLKKEWLDVRLACPCSSKWSSAEESCLVTFTSVIKPKPSRQAIIRIGDGLSLDSLDIISFASLPQIKFLHSQKWSHQQGCCQHHRYKGKILAIFEGAKLPICPSLSAHYFPLIGRSNFDEPILTSPAGWRCRPDFIGFIPQGARDGGQVLFGLHETWQGQLDPHWDDPFLVAKEDQELISENCGFYHLKTCELFSGAWVWGT